MSPQHVYATELAQLKWREGYAILGTLLAAVKSLHADAPLLALILAAMFCIKRFEHAHYAIC